MIRCQSKIKELWNNLKKQNKSLEVAKTKIVKDELKINSKILLLINESGEVVSQLDDLGFIILDKTNFKSHNNHSISDKGMISNDYFKAEVLDVDNTTFSEVTIHLVSVTSGIVNINNLELIVEVAEEIHFNLLKNKFASKVYLSFLENEFKIPHPSLVKTFISDTEFKVIINKQVAVNKKNIFLLRNKINDFLNSKQLNEQQNHFLIKKFNTKKLRDFSSIEKIEIKHINNDKDLLTITLLVGNDRINKYFDDHKKQLLLEINQLNKKIKMINHKELIEYYPQSVGNSYEKLNQLHRHFLKLKSNFLKFQVKHQNIIENLINGLEGTKYSENLRDYEVIHINFNHFLLNEKLLYQKTQKILNKTKNQILFVSNNDSENSILIITPSDDLEATINFKPLLNQFLPTTIKKISYNDKSICIESDNYQVITDFISTMINFLKISNKKYE